jgi:hypothetical protein
MGGVIVDTLLIPARYHTTTSTKSYIYHILYECPASLARGSHGWRVIKMAEPVTKVNAKCDMFYIQWLTRQEGFTERKNK